MTTVIVFLSSLLVGVVVTAQTAPNNLTAAKMTTESGVTKKMALAKEFIEIGGMKKEFEMAFLSGDAFLDRIFVQKNAQPTAEQKKILAAAKIKWQGRKNALFEETVTQLQKDISNNFSESELKYLVDLSKSNIYKRYRSYLESDAYTKFYNRPVEAARAVLEETKKELPAATGTTK